MLLDVVIRYGEEPAAMAANGLRKIGSRLPGYTHTSCGDGTAFFCDVSGAWAEREPNLSTIAMLTDRRWN